MPEPNGRATLVGEIAQGVYHFTMHDDRIDFVSESYAVTDSGHTVLIDPLPMRHEDLEQMGIVDAICLTSSSHERSAWRYRRELRVPVYAPQGGTDFEETPDHWYGHDHVVPGGLKALHAPGPAEAHYVFFLERAGVLFCGDLLLNPEGKGLSFLPADYSEVPDKARASAEALLSLSFAILCPDHGHPIIREAKSALAALLSAG